MRVRFFSILAGVACVALLGVAATAFAAPKLALHANKRVITYKQHAQLSGRLTSGKAGRTVVIKADQFPFGKAKIVARVRTRQGGRFATRVRPNLNTNYRAALKKSKPALQSNRAQVAISPRVNSHCNYCTRTPNQAGNFKLRLRSTFTFPTKAAARSNGKKPFFFYYGSRKGHSPPRRLKLRKRVDTKYLGGHKTRIKVVYRFHRPRSAYFSSLTGCVKDSPREDGIGLPGDHHCGDKSISHNLNYLGRSRSAFAARLP